MLKKKFLFTFGLFLSLFSGVYAQSYTEYKQKLQDEAKKYVTTVPCEGETRKAVENLNELIWANPSQNPPEKNKKIVESCKFVKSKGCPQQPLKTLLDEIAGFYRSQPGTATTAIAENPETETPVANIPDSVITSPESETSSQTQRSTSGTSSFPFWILTTLTTLLALVCAWLVMKVLHKPEITYIQSDFTMNNDLLEKLGDGNLIEILKQMREELSVLRKKVGSLEGEIEELRLKSKMNNPQTVSVEWPPEAENKPVIHIKERNAPSREDSQFVPPVPPVVAENVRYALYMDNSDGFSLSGLTQSEGHETIYQITLQSANIASYKISNNLDAQAYALSDPGYYLRTACDYDNSPTSGKHIETLSEGALELSGNVWKITRRARIRFV